MGRVHTIAAWGAAMETVKWVEWARFMQDSFKVLGAPMNHFGVDGNGLGTTKIRQVKKLQVILPKLDTCEVKWLSGYSLPEDFETAVFDYQIHMSRRSTYLLMSAKEQFSQPLLDDPISWTFKLAHFCTFTRGMLFETDEREVPTLFVSGASSPDQYRSLVVLKEINT